MRKSILLRVTSVALGLILSASALLAQKNINVTGLDQKESHDLEAAIRVGVESIRQMIASDREK